MKTISYYMLGAMLSILFITSCKKDEKPTPTTPDTIILYGEMELELEHFFGSSSFALNTDYTTGQGEQVNFSTAKYYISNIQLHKTDGAVWSQPDSYYLVDLGTPETAMLHLHDVPTGDYEGITFTVGVDSTRNVSGAQTGALSVSNNMFWSWNSGYIFIKLEGTSPQSESGGFSYHCGGFTGTNNAIRERHYYFSPAEMRIRIESAPVVHMTVDLKNVFDNTASPVSTAVMSNVHMPGANAKTVATNFADGIAFDHVHN